MFGSIPEFDMNKVYLVGLPASGKTTTAQWLAKRMAWQFFDLDASIEAETEMSITDYFGLHGEESFRMIEAECLRATKHLRNTVVGCGGGTAAFHGNMEWMKVNGLTIYLNTPLDVLVHRIAIEPALRPMFIGQPNPEIMTKLSKISEKRCVFHGLAKIIWNKSEPNELFYNAVSQLIAI
ncbi:MAG: hypothetical protein CK532_04005 [Flavobacteriales bacterium]|nr:MAG: hypothetical protein CK532_04005 [Flavobacteriales bacterium]